MLMSNMVIMLLAMYECTEEEIHVAAKGTNTTNECTEGPERYSQNSYKEGFLKSKTV